MNDDNTISELQKQINDLTKVIKNLVERIAKFETYINYVDQLDARMDEMENETFGSLSVRIDELEGKMSRLSSR